jgi:hypothetical protein
MVASVVEALAVGLPGKKGFQVKKRKLTPRSFRKVW